MLGVLADVELVVLGVLADVELLVLDVLADVELVVLDVGLVSRALCGVASITHFDLINQMDIS